MDEQAMNQNNAIRRKLLKAIVYAPPVILGSMVVTPRTVMGAIGQQKQCTFTDGTSQQIVISSGTNACCPCLSKPGPNGPVYSTDYDPVKCAKSQCKKSCGTKCQPGMIQQIDCKDFCKRCGTTPVGCNKPCVTCTADPNNVGEFLCN